MIIKSLKLQNFKQHMDKLIEFSEGLNVLRGPNEGGKSTIIDAFLYLIGGPRMLSQSESDIVTYFQKESSLRVEGVFEDDGVEYFAYRSPSGAEIKYGDRLITGKSSVTQFFERMFGSKIATMKHLMVAEQNSVRGVLESDSGAGGLIEVLAELGVIDEIIDKIKAQLPCGPTLAQQATINTLQAAVLAQPQEPSTEEFDAASLAAEQANMAYLSFTEEKSNEFSSLKLAVSNEEAVRQRNQAARATLATLSAVKAPEPCRYAEQDVQAAVEMEKSAEFAAEVSAARSVKFLVAETSLNMTVEQANEKYEELEELHSSLRKKEFAVSNKIAAKEQMKINEKVCSFCKKDISQLHEVAEVNEKVAAELDAMRSELAGIQSQKASAESYMKDIKAALLVESSNARKVDRRFWRADNSTTPSTYTWVGPEVAETGKPAVSSSNMKAAIKTFSVASAKYEAAQQQLAELKLEPEISDSELNSLKSKVAELKSKYESLRAAKESTYRAKEVQWGILQQRKVDYEKAVQQVEASKQALEDAKNQLDNMLFNNALIDDLRTARGQIRRKAWASVLAAISIYFSRIRKEDTVIAQTDDGFTYNGHPVAGLSGSAKDTLGLAIRAGLVKTFMPQAGVMIFDEPFAGCDARREVAGIGVLNSLGFPQTLLVTHSDLADTAANNMIVV